MSVSFFFFFAYGCPIYSAPLLELPFCLWFKKIVWIYLWVFYFVPLIYVSILSPIPHYLDSYILRVSLDIRSYKSCCFVFLFQDQHFKINMSISAKEAAGILIEIVLSLWINLGSIAILTTSSLQTHPYGMFSTYLEL